MHETGQPYENHVPDQTQMARPEIAFLASFFPSSLFLLPFAEITGSRVKAEDSGCIAFKVVLSASGRPLSKVWANKENLDGNV